MSEWRDRRNAEARRRLDAALPLVFPRPVLVHAFVRPLTPPLPRLAVESYWAAHPLRADRLARALAGRSAAPHAWTWRLSREMEGGLPRSFRAPPAPFREAAFAPGPGHCCVCGQPVFRFGWHRDLWGDGRPNRRAGWHACCVAAWKFWTAPNRHGRLLARLQRRRCDDGGTRLLRGAEVDHRVPLHRVWRDHRDEPWPLLLRFWGRPNLRVVNRSAHASKSASEARSRADHGRRPSSLGTQPGAEL